MAGSYACARVIPITVRVDCIKERIKLPVTKEDCICIYINLETRQITVVCSVKQFMAY